MHTKASLLALLFASAAAGGSALVDAQTAPGAYQTYPAQAPAYGAPNVSGALAQWHRLRQSDNLPFGEYASFLLNNRGWPGETALRRSAEAAIAPGLTPPSEVLRFFSGSEPQTGTGHLRRAEALLATGRTLEAQAAARTAWIEWGLRAVV